MPDASFQLERDDDEALGDGRRHPLRGVPDANRSVALARSRHLRHRGNPRKHRGTHAVVDVVGGARQARVRRPLRAATGARPLPRGERHQPALPGAVKHDGVHGALVQHGVRSHVHDPVPPVRRALCRGVRQEVARVYRVVRGSAGFRTRSGFGKVPGRVRFVHEFSHVARRHVQVRVVGDNLHLPQRAGQRARQHVHAHLHRLLRPRRGVAASSRVVKPKVQTAAELLQRAVAIGKPFAPHGREQQVPAEVRRHRGRAQQRDARGDAPREVLALVEPDGVRVRVARQRREEELRDDQRDESAVHRRQLTQHPRVRGLVHPALSLATQRVAGRGFLRRLHAPRRVRRGRVPRLLFLPSARRDAEERSHRGVPLGLGDDDGRAAVAPARCAAHERVPLGAVLGRSARDWGTNV